MRLELRANGLLSGSEYLLGEAHGRQLLDKEGSRNCLLLVFHRYEIYCDIIGEWRGEKCEETQWTQNLACS